MSPNQTAPRTTTFRSTEGFLFPLPSSLRAPTRRRSVLPSFTNQASDRRRAAILTVVYSRTIALERRDVLVLRIHRQEAANLLITLPETFNVATHFVDRNVQEGRGAKVAIECGDEQVTYQQLLENTNRVGNVLLALGVRPEERVLLLLLDTPEFLYSFFGAIKIGAVAVPVNTQAKTAGLRVHPQRLPRARRDRQRASAASCAIDSEGKTPIFTRNRDKRSEARILQLKLSHLKRTTRYKT